MDVERYSTHFGFLFLAKEQQLMTRKPHSLPIFQFRIMPRFRTFIGDSTWTEVDINVKVSIIRLLNMCFWDFLRNVLESCKDLKLRISFRVRFEGPIVIYSFFGLVSRSRFSIILKIEIWKLTQKMKKLKEKARKKTTQLNIKQRRLDTI